MFDYTVRANIQPKPDRPEVTRCEIPYSSLDRRTYDHVYFNPPLLAAA